MPHVTPVGACDAGAASNARVFWGAGGVCGWEVRPTPFTQHHTTCDACERFPSAGPASNAGGGGGAAGVSGWEGALGAHIDGIVESRLTTFEQRLRGITNAACADLERRLAAAVRTHVMALERRLAAALSGMASDGQGLGEQASRSNP